jgi:hypothetical protein
MLQVGVVRWRRLLLTLQMDIMLGAGRFSRRRALLSRLLISEWNVQFQPVARHHDFAEHLFPLALEVASVARVTCGEVGQRKETHPRRTRDRCRFPGGRMTRLGCSLRLSVTEGGFMHEQVGRLRCFDNHR